MLSLHQTSWEAIWNRMDVNITLQSYNAKRTICSNTEPISEGKEFSLNFL